MHTHFDRCLTHCFWLLLVAWIAAHLCCVKPQLYHSYTSLSEAFVRAGGSAWVLGWCHILIPSLSVVGGDRCWCLGGGWWRGTRQREQTGCRQQLVSDRRVSVKQWVTWKDGHVVGDVKAFWKFSEERVCVRQRESESKTESEAEMHLF